MVSVLFMFERLVSPIRQVHLTQAVASLCFSLTEVQYVMVAYE